MVDSPNCLPEISPALPFCGCFAVAAYTSSSSAQPCLVSSIGTGRRGNKLTFSRFGSSSDESAKSDPFPRSFPRPESMRFLKPPLESGSRFRVSSRFLPFPFPTPLLSDPPLPDSLLEDSSSSASSSSSPSSFGSDFSSLLSGLSLGSSSDLPSSLSSDLSSSLSSDLSSFSSSLDSESPSGASSSAEASSSSPS